MTEEDFSALAPPDLGSRMPIALAPLLFPKGLEDGVCSAHPTTNLPKTATICDILGHDDALTPLQERTLTVLLNTDSVLSAAKKARISPRTLHRWLGEPTFRRAYLAVRRQALEAATGNIQQLVTGAVSALERSLHCGVPGVELRAAQVIMEQAARGVEMLEFEERLHALESSHLPGGG